LKIGFTPLPPLYKPKNKDMYATSTALSVISSSATDVGLLVAAVVLSILTGWAALTGVGFFKRKVSHYVAGRKF